MTLSHRSDKRNAELGAKCWLGRAILLPAQKAKHGLVQLVNMSTELEERRKFSLA